MSSLYPSPHLPPASASHIVVKRLSPSNVSSNVYSCVAASWLSLWVIFLILLSTVSFILESLPNFHVDSGPELMYAPYWEALEAFVVIQFSLEYTARLVFCNERFAFLIEPMNVIDLVAILPWYLELLGYAGGGSAVLLRVLRLARVVRVFKLGKYAAGLQLFARTLVASEQLAEHLRREARKAARRAEL